MFFVLSTTIVIVFLRESPLYLNVAKFSIVKKMKSVCDIVFCQPELLCSYCILM
jgi:hypothetical protein